MGELEEKTLKEIMAEVVSWHSDTDRREGEFCVSEYIGFTGKNEDVAREQLRDDVKAGKLSMRWGKNNGKRSQFYSIIRGKFEETP